LQSSDTATASQPAAKRRGKVREANQKMCTHDARSSIERTQASNASILELVARG